MKIFITLIILIFSCSASFAQTYSLWNKVLDDGGTVATSSVYALKGSFGQSTIGVCSSSSYTANIGFFGVYLGWYWTTGIEEETSKNSDIALTFFLAPNSPNPFYSSTKIKYGLPKSCDVSIKIYNVAGQCIKTLAHSTQDAGIYEIEWNGEDNSNRKLPQGVYFLRMVAGDYLATSKIVMVR